MQLFTTAIKQTTLQEKSELHNSVASVKLTAAENETAIATAFTKATNLTASEFPQTLALFEHAICETAGLTKTINSDNLGGTQMALGAAGIKGRLSFFDKAVKEVLKKNKNFAGTSFIDFVNPKTDFNIMMLGLVRKYLSFYDEVDDVYDIVISAFTALFLDNFKKAFHDFDGVYLKEGGGEAHIKIEAYIYRLLARAIIQESKNLSKHLKDKTNLTPFEGESDEDALDREVGENLRKFNSTDQKLYDQLLKAVRGKIKNKRNYEALERVLQNLLLGLSATEISKKFKVSTTRIGDHVWYLKEALQKVAADLRVQGDSDLMDILEKNYKMVK